MDDPNGLLEGSGKEMRHIKIHKLDDIDTPVFTALVKQAASLEPQK